MRESDEVQQCPSHHHTLWSMIRMTKPEHDRIKEHFSPKLEM
jgi:hypothetical protein